MIEFRIPVKDEDRFNLYLRALPEDNYIKQNVVFEDVEKEYIKELAFGTERYMTFVAKNKGNRHSTDKVFYNRITTMFQDLEEYFGTVVEFRYVYNMAAVYDSGDYMYCTPFCKLI